MKQIVLAIALSLFAYTAHAQIVEHQPLTPNYKTEALLVLCNDKKVVLSDIAKNKGKALFVGKASDEEYQVVGFILHNKDVAISIMGPTGACLLLIVNNADFSIEVLANIIKQNTN